MKFDQTNPSGFFQFSMFFTFGGCKCPFGGVNVHFPFLDSLGPRVLR